jgi:hypothetical protein
MKRGCPLLDVLTKMAELSTPFLEGWDCCLLLLLSFSRYFIVFIKIAYGL